MMITRFPGLFIAFLIYVPPLLHANTGASDSFQAGFELYEQDKYDLAIPFLEKAVKLEPDNAIYHHILAKSYGREAERVNWLSAINLAKKTLSHLEIAANLDNDNLEILDDLMEYY
ncbi:MAG: tetratricopeptide repeat protein, partial [Proteobacteria bacterium]|nr:tetratricopeptide repeat protein [Pseudomonadota bacterium]